MLASLLFLAAFRAPNYAQFAKYGDECLTYVEKKLTPGVPGLYLADESGATANLRDHAELILALCAATSVDVKYKPKLQTALGLTEHYWDATGHVAGYRSNPHNDSEPRSYTDNALMANALLEAAAILQSPDVFAEAAKAMNFALSGTTPKAAGLLETEGTTHPLGLAPSLLGCLGVLETSPGPVSQRATDLYDWVRSTLRDPDTKLYHPNTDGMNDAPRQEDTAWLIRCAARLFISTKDEKYAEQARRLEEISLEVWPLKEGHAAGPIFGVGNLLESWFFRFKSCPRPLEQFGATTQALASLTFEHDRGRDHEGAYGPYWGIPPQKGEATLMNQACAARAFFIAAKFLQPEKQVR